MALQDILDAISAHADHGIEEYRQQHKQRLTEMRENNERLLSGERRRLAQQKEQRKTQLYQKTATHAALSKRNAVLTTKQECIDAAFEKALEQLCGLHEEKLEKLFETILDALPAEIEGELRPAKPHADLLHKLAKKRKLPVGDPIEAKGGFLIVSDTEEIDVTFEHLVRKQLRPRTELTVARMLFGETQNSSSTAA